MLSNYRLLGARQPLPDERRKGRLRTLSGAAGFLAATVTKARHR